MDGAWLRLPVDGEIATLTNNGIFATVAFSTPG